MTALRWSLILLALVTSDPLIAQQSSATQRALTVTVVVRRDTIRLDGVLVRSGVTQAVTDDRGIALLALPSGSHLLIARKIGFLPDSSLISLAGADTTVAMSLVPQPVELSGVMVSATRTGRRIEDEPLRVEALEPEEVEEKLLMTPGDITMMLNESSGLRVQTTSPSLGGAAVRVQGMRGRYTQILADGLPLYGGQTGGLGLLQIPPMDLGGVEIIKGVASALYGGSALGGVINLISRRPQDEPVRELLLNQTTLGGTDVVAFGSRQLSDQWGFSLLGGAHRQRQTDRDDDGWTDLPGYQRFVVRPRAFWSSHEGHAVILTAGTTAERREGGTLPGATVPTGGEFRENLRTTRHDAGLVGGFSLNGNTVLAARAAVASQRHRHDFGPVLERDRHLTWLTELSLARSHGLTAWLVGLAVQQERYDAEDVPSFDFSFTTPAVFAQSTVTLTSAASLTASARFDAHSKYGAQLSPRISALLRMGPVWTLRASAGRGYFAPSPFTEETEVIGLTPLEPLQAITEESARSASLDLGGLIGSLELNATLFASVVSHPIALRASSRGAGRVELVNLSEPTRTRGAEFLVRWNPEPFHVTGSYTFVRATEQDGTSGSRREMPLTPRHQVGIVTMWEREGRARAGLEIYYTGPQALENNPYSTLSRSYVHVGILAEQRVGRARVFINAENLLGLRQTSSEPLLLPARGEGGRWTTDVWGPLEGRVMNAGIRLEL